MGRYCWDRRYNWPDTRPRDYTLADTWRIVVAGCVPEMDKLPAAGWSLMQPAAVTLITLRLHAVGPVQNS